MMHNFKELKIWQKARTLASGLYLLSKDLPASERFGYLSQLQRAAISIPSNIAEGAGRNSDKEFCRFLDIAIGSSCEVESLLLIGVDLTYFTEDQISEHLNELNELQRMISGFKQKLTKGKEDGRC
ncbi:MAG TPA: four helix bundle protein [Tenuifilaceae bacterium]|jgi:four helix bundle protein|nr:four helix bundle protein [Tenuifilaceae bacterium]HPX04916.1 four helix bundle protein [Tenuifilaceae bacterium]HQB77691.1 four helix bundle protein [Tenuifilaceae bacterium]